MAVELVESSGSAAIDAVVVDFIDRCERHLSGRIRSYYLVGSQREGCAVAGSDLDLVLVLRSPVDEKDGPIFNEIVRDINGGGSFELGCNTREDTEILQGLAAYEKAAQLLFGEDLFADAPLLPIEIVARRWTAGALRLLQMLRGTSDPLRPPLDLPDGADPFCGYRLGERQGRLSTKRIVSVVARMAGALLAFEARSHAPSKRASLFLYRDHVGGLWGDYVVELYGLLNEEWQYALPTDDDGRRRLRALLEGLPGFETHFIETCRRPIVEGLTADDDGTRTWSHSCLDRVVYEIRREGLVASAPHR